MTIQLRFNFTPEAFDLWAKVPDQGKQKILANAWCSHCQAVTTMIDFGGEVVNHDLILKGVCSRCGGNVTRLLESS